MASSRRWLMAAGFIVAVLPALSGCNSTPGTGDKKTDLETWKGNGKPMPPEARAQMQAAMAHGADSAKEHHGPTSGAGDAPGQPPGQAQRDAAIQAAKNKAQENHGPN